MATTWNDLTTGGVISEGVASQVNANRIAAEAAKTAAETAAQQASGYLATVDADATAAQQAAATAADAKATVVPLASQVSADASAVATDRSAVQTLAGQVSGNAATVATQTGTVQTLAAQVSTDAGRAETARTQAESAAGRILPPAVAAGGALLTLTGTGAQTTFGLTGIAPGVPPSALLVVVDGILQQPSTAYSVGVTGAPATAAVVFSEAPANGAEIAVTVLPTQSGIAVVADAGGFPVTAPGTTTSRTLAQRAGDVLSVKDFGAKGDGVTDDTAAFQAALNAAAARGGGAVFAPDATYRLASGITIPDDVTLVGGSMLPGSPPSGTVLLFDLGVAACVTLTAGNLTTAGLKNCVVQRSAGVPPAGSVGVFVYRAYNVILEDVTVYNHARGFAFEAYLASGLGAFLTNVFTAGITENHFHIDSWPELRVSGGRSGANGVDYNGNAFIRITGSSPASLGVGPNTIVFDQYQFNQGVVGPKYWIDWDNVGTPQGNQGIFTFSNCLVENIATSYLRTAGAATLPNRFALVNSVLNSPKPMFALEPAVALNEWKLANNHIAATPFNPAVNNVNGLLVTNNTFVNVAATLTSPPYSQWTASFVGNVWGAGSSVTVAGDGWRDGLFLDVFSGDSAFTDASGSPNVRTRLGVPPGSPALAAAPFELIAHRGFARLAAENTMSAFTAAVAAGCTSLEMDVQISSDGVPVVIHDATVDRTTSGTGNVKDLTLAALQALDAGDFNPAFSPARIPTFDEVVKFARGRVRALYPEVKGYRTQADIDLMLSVVTSNRVEDLTVFQSFQISDLQYIRARNKNVGVGLLGADISQLSSVAALGGRVFYLLDYTAVLANPAWVTACRAKGVDVAVWTVDDGGAVQALLAAGVTRIMSNLHLGMGH